MNNDETKTLSFMVDMGKLLCRAKMIHMLAKNFMNFFNYFEIKEIFYSNFSHKKIISPFKN